MIEYFEALVEVHKEDGEDGWSTEATAATCSLRKSPRTRSGNPPVKPTPEHEDGGEKLEALKKKDPSGACS